MLKRHRLQPSRGTHGAANPNTLPISIGPELTRTPLSQFADDHWRVFLDVAATFARAGEAAHVRHCLRRINPDRHPAAVGPDSRWSDAQSTRVKAMGAVSAVICLPGHDDFDCLEDLQEAGLLEVRSARDLVVVLTDRGTRVLDAKTATSGFGLGRALAVSMSAVNAPADVAFV